ncbi:acetate kinase [Mucilaginibacter sp. CAU 1740]|uniref:acetate/propionate family kinase n=1 Tax=Mucilaginibacter sp. CAU 1740 TaxID=3140365 RepID=UPI00325BDE6A
MNIFVINSGSSSIKYKLFNGDNVAVARGVIERIGHEDAVVTHHYGNNRVIKLNQPVPDDEAGINLAISLLTRNDIAVIKSVNEIQVTGHRVVHGGEAFTKAVIITPLVKEKIKQLFPLAPLHNPADYKGIAVAEKILPNAVHVAVFDTAFHCSLPEKAFHYAIPQKFYKDDGVRVYGFHGINHKYVSRQAMTMLDKKRLKIISIHLGNGCSVAAIRDGVCVDTSMGLTPLDGLIMGTRSGAIDPSVVLFMLQQKHYNPEQVSALLNKESGLLGLTGKADMRDIAELRKKGDKGAILAYEMYSYRIKKFIGAYTAVMDGVDCLIFTGGVGENDADIRKLVCESLGYLGVELDEQLNKTAGTSIIINAAKSDVKVLVLPANEEMEIARQCRDLLEDLSSKS